MEFTKDINFNNSPTAGKDTKITYSGYLFQNGSNNVNIVYGFGEDWNKTTTQPMEKAEKGFETNVKIEDFDTFNFCFSNENNDWDNNSGFNYISPIIPDIPEVQTDDEDIDFGKDYSASIDSIIEDILGNTTKQTIITEKDNNSVDKILESINQDTIPEIEALFNDLFFESVKEDKVPSPIQEISMEPELADELKELGEDLENKTFSTAPNEENNNNDVIDVVNENVVNATVNTENNFNNENAELIALFNDLFEMSNTSMNFEIGTGTETEDISAEEIDLFEDEVEVAPIQEEVNLFEDEIEETPALEFDLFEDETEVAPAQDLNINVSQFNLDSLVENLLEPVIASETEAQKANDETSLFEDINSQDEEEAETSLAIINSGEFSVSPRKLGYFYKLRKRIRVAFMKLAKASKNFAKQLGF